MLQRYLDPATLASISGLDLVAKTVVDGFISGLHRSPDYGFSQEFAEYRAYTPGDDLRRVDWNVFARSERLYIKRYRGETNTQLLILIDTSASMAYGSHAVNKLDYTRYLAASLCYLAHAQRDAAGLIVFDENVQNYVAPSARQGQLFRLLHAIEKAQPGTHTDFAKPFVHFLDFTRQEIAPKFREPVLLTDMETSGTLEVSPEYAHGEYRHRIDAHIQALRDQAKGAGLDYFLMDTGRPLDEGLREYLGVRQGRL